MVPRAYISSNDIEDNADLLRSSLGRDTASPTWKLSLPHVLVATIVPFLFGYHIGVVNEPLETISVDLGFHGNTLQEGFVVSTCLAGALLDACSVVGLLMKLGVVGLFSCVLCLWSWVLQYGTEKSFTS
ncbi:UNVERIFIED_CONTAM: putative plastidic glucose transporter 2 [Sesamum calycinum]|uniref:Plastidic glucose transporter 2 n=1 Tax=Sesamum calycinum TaxID=2727403 RepID=A0AAW2NTT3_9LAMI